MTTRFTIEDLCERIWPEDVYQDPQAGRIERKHRATVIRAGAQHRSPATRKSNGSMARDWQGARVSRHDEVMSYAMARLKADRFQRYRSKDPRLH